jgi:hypothetical protein
MRIAKFTHIEYGGESVSTSSLDGCPTYIRTSEYVDVTFPPLAESAVIESQVAALEAAAEEIQAKAHDAVQNIKARIMELRYLTNGVQS